MKDFRFETILPISTNEEAMEYFLNNRFPEVFSEDAVIIENNGSYAEVEESDGLKWGLHSSGDGDFVSHRIRFEEI